MTSGHCAHKPYLASVQMPRTIPSYIRGVIRGPDVFDDGDYREDEFDERFEMVSDHEEDEGTNLDVEEASGENDEDDDFQSEDEDLMGDIYG
jgi:hypothetical protein